MHWYIYYYFKYACLHIYIYYIHFIELSFIFPKCFQMYCKLCKLKTDLQQPEKFSRDHILHLPRI